MLASYILFFLYVEMVHRWNSGVFYRRSCSISNFCYSSTDNVCNLDCDNNRSCDGKNNGVLLFVPSCIQFNKLYVQ